MKKTALTLLLLATAISIQSQTTFNYGTFTSSLGITLPFRQLQVGDAKSGNSLVVYLHGGTSRGSDNESQLQEPAVDSISSYLYTHHIPALMVVPQCPTGGGWLGGNSRAVKELIDSLVSTGKISRSNIYVFGGSMGGTGTWNLVNSYPGLFAAAMPCAGNPSACDASKVAQTPIYTVMGTADNIMSIPAVDTFTQALTAQGGEYKYDIEEGWTHENTCIMSYTSDRIAWVLGHTKSSTGISRITSAEKGQIVYDLEGRRLEKLPLRGIVIVNGKKVILRNR